MVLGFKEYYFVNGIKKPTFFKEKILLNCFYQNDKNKQITCPKIHTIRSGNRWKVGDKMHMAYGVRTKKYHQFNKDIPELEIVKSVQEIKLWTTGDLNCLIDNKPFENLKLLSINDGFDEYIQFHLWFSSYKPFSGQIIHFTDFRY